ncbi:MAG: hypothetical protein J0L70_26405 [Leptolyngbya sp. UWPOB_LEPTO1]|uniref:hypothetical protein n=1 Tax=Leptolyngbya sp. UWPOB_LEPTO1 TaxID=2815653 RepID=UPI001ACD7B94|nr:hypothetical protein [Leptolyngbya sp. UWPOB_LEPTO1]MBN8564073.1 hypothetical protein [Leptolyngbya sp. UWPOB_LEPTO1]
MPFPKSAQSKGGKAPASAVQKQAAREWVQQHRPWRNSTGARSPLGKLSVKYNAVLPGSYKRFVKSWEEDFEQGCLEAEQAIFAFEADRRLYPADYASLQVKRYQGQDGNGNRWCLFMVYATYIGSEETTQDRITVARAIRTQFHSAKKCVDRVLWYGMPSWLENYLGQPDLA